jgi:HSP20 family protein
MLRRFDPFARAAGFTPAVDIFEDKESISVRAELAGLKAEDVHVSVENDVLTLRGERKLEREEQKQGYRRIERAYGSFTRSFALPEIVDGEKIHAEMKDGVLTLRLPKKGEAQPRRVDVKAA